MHASVMPFTDPISSRCLIYVVFMDTHKVVISAELVYPLARMWKCKDTVMAREE